MKPLTAHAIAADERGHVRCDMPRRGVDALEFCPDPAVMRETYPGGLVHHYCAECWVAPPSDGGPSPAENAGVDLPDTLDYERRWLAECRAHGETRRKLQLAHHELGEHSLCDGDCDGGIS